LSTAVVEVAKRFQCVSPTLTHVWIPRNATELNKDAVIKSGNVHYQSPTERNLSIFLKEI